MLRRFTHELGRNNVLLMLALFIWALGEGLWFNNFRQLYLADLGAAPPQIGFALAVEAIVKAMMLIPMGYLADRIGAYRVVVASWVLGVLGPMLLIPAVTWQWAIPGLIVYAMSGFAIPSVSAFALNSIPDKTVPHIHQRVLTAIFAAYPAGLIISPAIGGLIADRWGIRACLALSAALFILSLITVLFTHHVAPVALEHHAEHPRDLLRNKRFVLLGFYYSVAIAVMLLAYLLAPNFFEEVRRFTLSDIGILYSAASVGTVLFNLIAGRMNRRWSYLMVLVVFWLGAFGAWQSLTLTPASIAFIGLGAIWTARTLATSGISSVVQPENRGFSFGLLETVFALMGAGAAGLAGHLYGTQPGLPFVATLVGVPILAILWFAIRPLLDTQSRPSDA